MDKDIARQRLVDALSDEQRAMLRAHNYFELTSNLGNTWRVYCQGGHQGNVYKMREDGAVRSYCAQSFLRDEAGLPTDCCAVPNSDHYLTQALWLRTDEAGFLEIAL